MRTINGYFYIFWLNSEEDTMKSHVEGVKHLKRKQTFKIM